ncbi:MAG: tetratricopeptide repeat protein [Candidatus Nitronauta litoralis]|uniref:Tetratricopeptide repeat protein n=1 Tax=Candidatus Nitronauta litoralis TaxID=2705533 RepID=A0A7T0FZ08_9BACT|nr:MAG: tetratricopeptide repeat protein [Candidatus Nitronauta litoralis]
MKRNFCLKLRRAIGQFFLISLIWSQLFTSANGFEVNKGALALLIAKDVKGEVIGTGTGFVAEPTGLLVTNYHVILDANTIEAVFQNGRRVGIQGVNNLNRRQDWAILQLEKGFYSTLEIGDSAALKNYDYTTALGFPSQRVHREQNGLIGPLVQTHGFVLGIHPQALPDFSFIYTSTPFDPGYSGGPLLDQDNKVVGLATLEGRSINLALPIEYVKPYLKPSSPKTLTALRKEDQNSPEALYYKGNFALYALGDSEKAIEYFEQSLSKDSSFIPARYDLAVAYRGLGQTDRAIAEYEKIIKANPKFPEALSNLGGQYFRKGETEKAIKYFTQALQVYPNFVQGLSNLGAALNKVQRFEEALPHLKRATDLDPEFAITQFNLGNSYFGLGQFEKAEHAFNTARTQGVDFLSLHWKLYEIYNKSDRQKEAIRELEMILEMDPMNQEAAEKLKSLKPQIH